jgi:hypothetical protein
VGGKSVLLKCSSDARMLCYSFWEILPGIRIPTVTSTSEFHRMDEHTEGVTFS